MGLKKLVLNIILSFVNIFVSLIPIKKNQIAFVSLEDNGLKEDFLDIYNHLDHSLYSIKTVLIHYDKKSIWNDFLYLLNCIKQIIVINTSHIVLINDNNYVVSHYKRQGVKVIEVWHATGAIKKFGNAVKRQYPINNYDYVIANSDYWIEPYSLAFSVEKDNVLVTGMPRVDHLFDENYKKEARDHFYSKYPELKNKKILLYAPTFRGNIYKGFKAVPFDGKKFISSFDKDTVLIYKYHPLMKDIPIEEEGRIFNMSHENTYELFIVSDALISDFSSIIFDYSILDKPLYFFVPDLKEYMHRLGCFVDYKKEMPGPLCYNEIELADAIHSNKQYDIKHFKNQFFKYQDGKNVERVISFIEQLIKED